MKHTGLAKKNSKSRLSWNRKREREGRRPRFVVCVLNKDFEASLELRKVYQVLPDKTARQRGMLRVIDESGEDYLYPAELFIPIGLPRGTKKSVLMGV